MFRQVHLAADASSSFSPSSSSSSSSLAKGDNGAATQHLLFPSCKNKKPLADLQRHSSNLHLTLNSAATPHPGAFKCFTCQEAADNYECNRWAPDVYCPQGKTACMCYYEKRLSSITSLCNILQKKEVSCFLLKLTNRCPCRGEMGRVLLERRQENCKIGDVSSMFPPEAV